MPFPEHFFALCVGAAEESNDSPGPWALVLVDDKVLGAWDVLFDSNLVKIKVTSLRNLYDMVISDNLSIDKLGVDIKVILFLDLSLGKILGSGFLSLFMNNSCNFGQFPTLRDDLNTVIIRLFNDLVRLWCLWLILSDFLRVLAYSGNNKLLDHVLIVATGLLGFWYLILDL